MVAVAVTVRCVRRKETKQMALYALGDFHLSFGVRSRLREANLNGGDDLPGDAQAARGVSMDKPMDIFGRELPCMQGNSPTRRACRAGGLFHCRKNHEKKIEKYSRKLVKPEDTLVITGDHSSYHVSSDS